MKYIKPGPSICYNAMGALQFVIRPRLYLRGNTILIYETKNAVLPFISGEFPKPQFVSVLNAGHNSQHYLMGLVLNERLLNFAQSGRANFAFGAPKFSKK